jgi:hypothetical protein
MSHHRTKSNVKLGTCRYCGCTDEKPCIFRAPGQDGPPFDLWPCAWLLEDVCSAPACVEKAYRDAWLLAEVIEAEAAA